MVGATTIMLTASTITPSAISLIVSTRTPLPSAMPRPLEPTFPPGPTLTAEESQNEIAKLMQGNPDCLFPCWWGIVPGKTSRFYTTAALTYLNLKWVVFELPEGMEFGSPFVKDGDFIRATVGYTVIDDIVEDIHIRGDGSSDQVFAKRWEYYSLTEMLKTYGLPTRFWAILVEGGEVGSSRNSYHLLVFYDEAKALIRYTGSTETDVLCPDFNTGQVDWLDIYLQSPDTSRKLTDITNVSRAIEMLDQPDVYRVEKMTESRIIELYNLFTQSKEPACFRISAN